MPLGGYVNIPRGGGAGNLKSILGQMPQGAELTPLQRMRMSSPAGGPPGFGFQGQGQGGGEMPMPGGTGQPQIQDIIRMILSRRGG